VFLATAPKRGETPARIEIVLLTTTVIVLLKPLLIDIIPWLATKSNIFKACFKEIVAVETTVNTLEINF